MLKGSTAIFSLISMNNFQPMNSEEQFRSSLAGRFLILHMKSTLLNFMDNSFQFRYVEFAPLEFDPSTHNQTLFLYLHIMHI